MKKLLLALSLAAACGSASAIDLTHPYFGVLASTLVPDSDRPNVRPWGAQFITGFPLQKDLSLEPNAYIYYMPRKSDNKADLSWGGGVDLVKYKSFQGLSAFWLAGGGFSYEDVTHVDGVGGYLNVGFGLIKQLPFLPGWQLRGEVRGVLEFNDVATERRTSNVTDARISFGLQHGFRDYESVVEAKLVDSDGDGVFDGVDQCPNTPPGVAVDAVGCPAKVGDADGDGVSDLLDQCPGTPAGTVVDATGCPIAPASGNDDEDGDGVPNALDKCPNTPHGFKVDETGCLVEQTVALQSVNFEFGSDQLTVEAKAILDGIAKSLAVQQAVKVQVTGHTDALGPQSYNLNLSQKRARSVVAYLVAAGVDAKRLKSDGEGEFTPIATNDTEAGRAKNRRVEFKILTQ